MERPHPSPSTSIERDDSRTAEQEKELPTPTIFLVDDDLDKQTLFRDIIADIGNVVPIVPAHSGEDAIEIITTHVRQLAEQSSTAASIPVLVALDANFPRKNGDNPDDLAGISTATALIDFCNGKNGTDAKKYPLPYFIGISSNPQQNERLRALIEKEHGEEQYLGDIWQQFTPTSERVTALLAPQERDVAQNQ
jgi:CheY-like chemotaxis protein